MRLVSLVLASVLWAAAADAEGDPARLVRGTWALDVKISAEKQERYEDATPEQRESLARNIAAATPDARFEFSEARYSYGWSGKIVQKGTFEVGFGDKAPGREVIGLTIHPEDGDDDLLSIRMEGADVMHLRRHRHPLYAGAAPREVGQFAPAVASARR